MSKQAVYRQIIQGELARRCRRNTRYSLRAFANALGISNGALSHILSGRRIPSLRTAEKLVRGLNLMTPHKEVFLRSLAETQRSRDLQRLNPAFRKLLEVKHQPAKGNMDARIFETMSEWYHVALIELTNVDGFKPDPRWIAEKLKITHAQASSALECLLFMGFLEQKEDKIVRASAGFATKDRDATTAALRHLQKQFMERAISSLENDPIDVRNTTTLTMAVDVDKIPLAKKMMEEFAQSLCQFLEAGKRTRVYNLSISFYPLSEKLEK
jgi:uncharacterized protein (TIGR02147 family)